jgi:soluble lytic murein transglycosylase-like protein
MIRQIMDFAKEEAQKRGLLPPGQVKKNYVPHELDFDSTNDPTKRRLYDSIHELWQNDLPVKDTDLYSLAAKYVPRIFSRIRNYDAVTDLKAGRTLDGAPLAVNGGFVEGQNVAVKSPQSAPLGKNEIQTLTKSGQLPDLIRAGRVVKTDDGGLRWKVDDYKEARNLVEERPIGPTPIPEHVLTELKANGALDKLVAKNLVYQDKNGEYFNTEPLRARVPVYLHPDIADHFNTVVKPDALAKPTTWFGRRAKNYDDISGNMKSLLFWGSPFHKVTEAGRIGEAMFNAQGLKLAGKSIMGSAEPIDYANLTPMQEKAIYSGIVTGVDPRSGHAGLHVAEGLASDEGSWGAKLNSLVDRTLGAAVEKAAKKIGWSDGAAHTIRRNIDLQKVLVDDVFGPRGTITQQKMAMFEDKYPKIAAQIVKDHPDWTPAEVDKQAGALAAEYANNKFGGLNHVLLGRTLQDQRTLRRLLLAPDFLESTGRSVLDLARPYNADLVSNLIKFNLVHLATAAGLNLAIHHKTGDSIADDVQNSHVLDHPYGVVSPDGKSVYGLRTTIGDFLHLVEKPREFAYDRTAPILRSVQEILEQRNAYGRRESLYEAMKSLPKAGLPIQLQAPLGLGAGSVTEPTPIDQFLKSIGISAHPNRTPAENAAIELVSGKLMGTEAQTGQALLKKRMMFNAEDRLRDAYQALRDAKKDPKADFIKLQADVNNAARDVDTLARKRVITPEERKRVLSDAQSTRLVSIFKRLDPRSSLDIWDKASDQERMQLGRFMHEKYMNWTEEEAKKGVTANTLSPEDQQILNRFRAASAQLTDLSNRPAAKPRPTQQVAEKVSRPLTLPALAPAPYNELPAPIPAAYEETPLPAPVPVPTRTEPMSDEELSPMIKAASDKYGVDEDLIRAVIKQESNGSPVALSPRGAQGIMQLMDATAKQYGVRNVFDPAENIDAGVHFLADLLKRYDGDVEKTLAAYNAGPERVDEAGGVPQIPETQAYVRAIMKRVKG